MARKNLARLLEGPKPLLPLSPPTPSGLPRLRFLAQFRESYLLAEGEGTLYIVDQHAAHERVIFEELKRRLEAEGLAPLPYPVLVELSPGEEERLGQGMEGRLFVYELWALEGPPPRGAPLPPPLPPSASSRLQGGLAGRGGKP